MCIRALSCSVSYVPLARLPSRPPQTSVHVHCLCCCARRSKRTLHANQISTQVYTWHAKLGFAWPLSGQAHTPTIPNHCDGAESLNDSFLSHEFERDKINIIPKFSTSNSCVMSISRFSYCLFSLFKDYILINFIDEFRHGWIGTKLSCWLGWTNMFPEWWYHKCVLSPQVVPGMAGLYWTEAWE